MPLKVFLTGATGYVGGTAHAYLAKAHPEWEFNLLVRDEERAKPIKAKYPNTIFAYGTLGDADLVQNAAAEADIVVHTADSADNEVAAINIAKGLASTHSAKKPAYWIHTSGTGVLLWNDAKMMRYGEPPLPDQTYHDINDIDRLLTLPDSAEHRAVDKIVQAAASDAIKIAILCPPTIYGQGAGQVNRRSIQVPNLARVTLERGFAPVVGAGKAEADNVHIDDLGQFYVLLADATQDPLKANNSEIFGPHAYFFSENASHRWADVASRIARAAKQQGFFSQPEVKSISQEDVIAINGVSTHSYGMNSKGIGLRARKYLGWVPTEVHLEETIDETVAMEAEALGLTPQM